MQEAPPGRRTGRTSPPGPASRQGSVAMSSTGTGTADRRAVRRTGCLVRVGRAYGRAAGTASAGRPPYGPPGPAPEPPPVRRAYRRFDGRVVSGVAGGIADHLNVPDIAVRLVFIAATVFGGFGVLIYAALWFLMPLAAPTVPAAPGLAAHTRQNMRSDLPPPPVSEARTRRREKNRGQLIAIVVVAAGVLLLLQAAGLGIAGKMFWPLVFAGTGLALIWRQADETQKAAWTNKAPTLGNLLGKRRDEVDRPRRGRRDPARYGGHRVPGAERPALAGRRRTGRAAARGRRPRRHRRPVGAPAEPRPERRARRADPVAGTRRHGRAPARLGAADARADPEAGGRSARGRDRLARSQERELRAWLYDEDDQTDKTLAGAAKRAAAEVEDSHGVPVEVVTVGDCDLTEGLSAMVRAARESMVNAAKHSGADKIDVFVEVDGDRAEMFVRDRGKGFDTDGVPEDRLGLRHSVMGRMERHGGRATVRSSPETGTEVRLEMDR